MKFIAILLACYVGLLASWPTLDLAEVFPPETCCLELCADDDEQAPEPAGSGCDEVCNPFLSCACCLGFTTIPAKESVWIDHHDYCLQNSRINQFLASQIIFPVWHPPRV